jgi:hypothetical protein
MAAAPFVWRADGRPDWGAMWTSFCELALFGGPPHRGPEQALRGADAGVPEAEMLAEIQRGIWETTRLRAEPAGPGWIAVGCESAAMAEWLAAAIVLENVEARVDAGRLLLPAGPGFRLDNEVKSLVTVVAKTHHYWAMHRARSRNGLARPFTLGVGGPGDGKTRLVDALRRRYGRRRAVLMPSPGAAPPTDHAVDLALVELGEEPEPSAPVDATLGVFAAAELAAALRHGDRAPDAWHLLVVATAKEGTVDLERLERDAGQRRGGDPVAFVDFATGHGIDAIVSWLQREHGLDPWKARPA